MNHRVRLGMIATLLACGYPLSAAPPGGEKEADLRGDARLARRVKLRADGIPLAWVLRELGRASGVGLQAVGTVGDERLIAFVPESPLSEVMLAVADLYRLEWLREGGTDRPRYRLVKPEARRREEQRLRNQALSDLLDRLEARLRGPVPPGQVRTPDDRTVLSDPTWAPLYPHLLTLVSTRRPELQQAGFFSVPMGDLPAALREPMLSKAAPVVRRQEEQTIAAVRDAREREAQKPPGQPRMSFGEPSIIPVGEYVVAVEVSIGEGLRATIQALAPRGAGLGFGWAAVEGNDLQDEGLRLYADRRPRVPGQGERPTGPAATGDDPLLREVAIPPDPSVKARDWIRNLRRLSAAAGVSLYADCYPSWFAGQGSQPRAEFALPGRGAVAPLLDAFCGPKPKSFRSERLGAGFWWRRGDGGRERSAVLVRSRRWLWESLTPLPASFLEPLVDSVGRTRRADPGVLAALPRLTLFQLRSLTPSMLNPVTPTRQRLALVARLSPTTQKRLLEGWTTWTDLPAADRAVVSHLAASPPGTPVPSFRAQVMTAPQEAPELGGTFANLYFRSQGERMIIVTLPLPGVGPPPELAPRGLVVEVADR